MCSWAGQYYWHNKKIETCRIEDFTGWPDPKIKLHEIISEWRGYKEWVQKSRTIGYINIFN